MRVGIIGDIGGHLDVFAEALTHLGVDVAGASIPADLVVVQVGDLVHKGPDDTGCVTLADRLLATGRYVQLWGNHDAHYIGGPDVSSRPGVQALPETTAAMLERWYETGSAQLAYALESVELGPVLITHGGLTQGLWKQLGEPATPDTAAPKINELLNDPDRAFRPGWLMTGHYDDAAGVTCPRTGVELAAPWLEQGDMPFSQVHGHEGVWYWPEDRFHDDCPQAVRKASVVDHARRFCEVQVGKHTLMSVDWVLGAAAPRRPWVPLELHLPGSS